MTSNEEWLFIPFHILFALIATVAIFASAPPVGAQTPVDPCASFRAGSPDLPDSEDLYRQCQGLFSDKQSSDDPIAVIVIGTVIALLLFVAVPLNIFVAQPILLYLDHRRDRRENPWKYLPEPRATAMPPSPHVTYPENWDELRRMVYRRDEYRCQEVDCMISGVVVVAHHIVPLWDGGSNDLSNLVTLCEPCHQKRHVVISAERREFRRQLRRNEFQWDTQTVVLTIIGVLAVAWFVAFVALR